MLAFASQFAQTGGEWQRRFVLHWCVSAVAGINKSEK
jgi:hypothetical protein